MAGISMRLKSTMAGIFLAGLAVYQSCLADDISRELLFSEKAFIGGVHCNEETAGIYCERPLALFDANGEPLGTEERIVGACVRGGGDCDIWLLVYEKKEVAQNLALARVETTNGHPAWIKVSQDKFKDVLAMMPA